MPVYRDPMQSRYWNKTEIFWWVASAAVLIAYAVAVLVFGVDADPWNWID